MIRTIVIVVNLLVLCGCTQYVDTACGAFAMITYSASGDTPDTKDQIKKHNAAYKSICR